MPRHQHVTTCLHGGPVSKLCPCLHCTLHGILAICAVCHAYEPALTSDCPGTEVPSDKQREVHETALDYTDHRGWHMGSASRSPRFAAAPQPSSTSAPDRTVSAPDPRAVVAPTIDWERVDRAMMLQHQLTQHVIAWVLADRTCDDHSAALVLAEDLATRDGELAGDRLEQAQLAFKTACREVERCEDEWKQAARRLVDVLEQDPAVSR